MSRYLLTNASIVTGTSCRKGSVGIDGERIAGIWYGREPEFPDARFFMLLSDCMPPAPP